MLGLRRMGNPTVSVPGMDEFLSCVIRNLMMPGASFKAKQLLSSFGKTGREAEGRAIGRAGTQYLSHLRRKNE
jgi:hypothetical protein